MKGVTLFFRIAICSIIFILVVCGLAHGQDLGLSIDGDVISETLLDDGFEDGTLSPFTDGGDAAWSVQSAIVFEGVNAARSGSLIPGESTFMSYVISSTESYEVIFWYRLQSITDFDQFTFSANGDVLFENSGIQGWKKQAFDRPPGTDTLTWQLNKGLLFFNSYVVIDAIQIRSTSGMVFQLRDGTEGFGKILISDSEGKAYWKDANTLFDQNELPIIAEGSDRQGFIARSNTEEGILSKSNEYGLVSLNNTAYGIRSDSNNFGGYIGENNLGPGFTSGANSNEGFLAFSNGTDGYSSISNGRHGYRAGQNVSAGFYAEANPVGIELNNNALHGAIARENGATGYYALHNGASGFRADSNAMSGFLAFNNQGNGFWAVQSGDDGFVAEQNNSHGFVSKENSGDGFYACDHSTGYGYKAVNNQSGFSADSNDMFGVSALANQFGYYAAHNVGSGFLSFFDFQGFAAQSSLSHGFRSVASEINGYEAQVNGNYGFYAHQNVSDGFVSRNHSGNNGFRAIENNIGFSADSNNLDGFNSEHNQRYGFRAANNGDDGFISVSNNEEGYFAASNVLSGIFSTANGMHGVQSTNNTMDGIYSFNNAGDEGYFAGTVTVTGALSKGSGSFKIDHPLDPENKYLYHSFVESPDMMNVYNGNIITDEAGFATVLMPEWFDALNRDFRYQLTVIGSFAQAIIKEKLSNNQFIIQTDKPAIEVSWQITGIRHDPYAKQNRIQVEVEKEAEYRGRYLHPDAYEKPFEESHEFVKLGHKTLEEIYVESSKQPQKHAARPK